MSCREAGPVARKRFTECEDAPERVQLTFTETLTELTVERLEQSFVPVVDPRAQEGVVVPTRPSEVLRLRY